jgi:hypothetical protein
MHPNMVRFEIGHDKEATIEGNRAARGCGPACRVGFTLLPT